MSEEKNTGNTNTEETEKAENEISSEKREEKDKTAETAEETEAAAEAVKEENKEDTEETNTESKEEAEEEKKDEKPMFDFHDPSEQPRELENHGAKHVSKTKGMSLWMVIVLVVGIFALIFVMFKKNGSILVNPDEWSESSWGRRDYIYVNYDSQTQADYGADFTFNAPSEIKGLSTIEYWAVNKYVYDYRYLDSDGNTCIILHKCLRDDLEEADDKEYDQNNKVDIDGITVKEKGSNDLVQSALWEKDGYYYQIITSDSYMLTKDEVAELVPKIF